MSYEPRPESRKILRRALYWVQSVEYSITARWVFYRLLQDGTYSEKGGYKHLLGLLSKARKEFYDEWRPWTLADDTRAPILMQRLGFYTIKMRGSGFKDEKEWLKRLRKEINCPLDRWANQPVYAEIWFEAAAMQGQFLHYANENIPLLAFHGDVSIPEKWRCALRLASWWLEYRKPIHIFYCGDLDPKGLLIPLSAWRDIATWAQAWVKKELDDMKALGEFHFHRIGINEDQVAELNLPENPERPGTYQWEALDDEQAEQLIESANESLNLAAFDEVELQEQEIAQRLKQKLGR
jgi:hypothetical protein